MDALRYLAPEMAASAIRALLVGNDVSPGVADEVPVGEP